MKAIRCFISLLLLLWLAGCASSATSTARYTLPEGQLDAENADASPRRTLIVENVQVASYLNGQGIVLQRDDVLLHQASSHLWAEKLDRQLSRGLRQRLANRLPDTRVLGGGDAPNALHLRVEVDQFQGRYDGMAVAGGRWQLRDTDGELLVFEPFTATVALERDGYPALVRALGRSWDRVAARIAERIESRP